MKKWNLFYTLIVLTLSCSSITDSTSNVHRLIGEHNYLSGYEAINEDGTVNVVVEIPTGTVEKWEVEKSTGELVWTVEDENLRIVNYLGYPGNYGMIPKTFLAKELGGDGDPLDVLILGAPIERGKVVKVKIIGVLKLLDRGEQDDKLIAVTDKSRFSNISTIIELQDDFLGVAEIIELWFTNYKGVDKMQSFGYLNVMEANKILYESVNSYNTKNK